MFACTKSSEIFHIIMSTQQCKWICLCQWSVSFSLYAFGDYLLSLSSSTPCILFVYANLKSNNVNWLFGWTEQNTFSFSLFVFCFAIDSNSVDFFSSSHTDNSSYYSNSNAFWYVLIYLRLSLFVSACAYVFTTKINYNSIAWQYLNTGYRWSWVQSVRLSHLDRIWKQPFGKTCLRSISWNLCLHL